jgi:uncharacterized protein YecT (DUF1311 family)
MKKIIPLCLLALTFTACSTAPKAPESQPVVVEQPAASTPAPDSTSSSAQPKPAASELSGLSAQLAQACSSGVKELCSANDQVVALLNNTVAASSSNPSFNCAKAGSEVEKAICGSKPLSTLDAILAKRYKAAGNNPTVKADQRTWMASRNACADAECVAARYAERLLQLGSR